MNKKVFHNNPPLDSFSTQPWSRLQKFDPVCDAQTTDKWADYN